MLSKLRSRSQIMLFVVAIIIAMLFAFFFFGVDPILAQEVSLTDVGDAAGLQETSLPTVIGRIIGVFLGFLGIIFLILMLYAGFLWMTAAGNAANVDKAKKILIQAVVGLIITLSAFTITNFVVSSLTGTGVFSGIGGGGGAGGTGPGFVSVPRSGSLGQGGILEHYPRRNASDVSRNTRIFVTFKEAMDVDAFISNYDDNGTPDDITDDSATLNANNIKIYPTNEGKGSAFASENVAVSFTEDLKTVTFNPPLLGSATDDVQYTVFLDDKLKSADGKDMVNNGGYEWLFTVGTTIDLDPPTVRSITPAAGGLYDRNISVQITFSEAIDPTSSTGTFLIGNPDLNFGYIQTTDASGIIVEGTYSISNEYKTITFETTESCGTNSCNTTIYCLPASQAVTVMAVAATPGSDPPQVDIFPYDGIVDTSGNALDGNGDDAAGDDFVWAFDTTDDINLSEPSIESISPEVLGPNTDIDQRVLITFDDVMLANSFVTGALDDAVSPGNIALQSSPFHEMSYSLSTKYLNNDLEDVLITSEDISKTELTISHGLFFVSTEEQAYNYSVDIGADVLNQYQNCFNPSSGPNATGGVCEGSPYCCNGSPSSTACSFF